jgi:hypothetical protein
MSSDQDAQQLEDNDFNKFLTNQLSKKKVSSKDPTSQSMPNLNLKSKSLKKSAMQNGRSPRPEESDVPMKEPDEIDLMIEDLTTQLMLSSCPNPGNLRSSKRKDIRLRIKCFNALLQQR